MSKKKKIIIICLAPPLTIIVLLRFTSFIIDYSSGEYAFQKSFISIHVGMKNNEVIAVFGKPDDCSLKFRLGQYENFEKYYYEAEKRGSEHYLFWYRGIDTVYTIGFDHNHQVAYTASLLV